MYACMSRKKKHGFSSVFAKRTSKNIEFFQIFGKRMQEAQASKKADRGNRAWDPCFATPAPRRLRLVERHQIAPPPKKNLRNRRRAAGGLGGGGYPLSSSKYPTRRAMSADFLQKSTHSSNSRPCLFGGASNSNQGLCEQLQCRHMVGNGVSALRLGQLQASCFTRPPL